MQLGDMVTLPKALPTITSQFQTQRFATPLFKIRVATTDAYRVAKEHLILQGSTPQHCSHPQASTRATPVIGPGHEAYAT